VRSFRNTLLKGGVEVEVHLSPDRGFELYMEVLGWDKSSWSGHGSGLRGKGELEKVELGEGPRSLSGLVIREEGGRSEPSSGATSQPNVGFIPGALAKLSGGGGISAARGDWVGEGHDKFL
jgi:hypothetical protein